MKRDQVELRQLGSEEDKGEENQEHRSIAKDKEFEIKKSKTLSDFVLFNKRDDVPPRRQQSLTNEKLFDLPGIK